MKYLFIISDVMKIRQSIIPGEVKRRNKGDRRESASFAGRISEGVKREYPVAGYYIKSIPEVGGRRVLLRKRQGSPQEGWHHGYANGSSSAPTHPLEALAGSPKPKFRTSVPSSGPDPAASSVGTLRTRLRSQDQCAGARI